MGILIKKRQAGGSLFANPDRLVLNANTPTQRMNTTQPKGSYGGSAAKQASKKSATDLKDALPSDLKFYKQEEARIARAIAEGIAANEHFDDTPEYEMLLKEHHNLMSVKIPQLKSMNELYKTGYKKFSTNAAGDAPAIVNDQAIVQVIDRNSDEAGRYKTVHVNTLLTDAKQYRLLKGQEVLKHRHNNSEFSGFTDLGVYADQVISTAYGSKNYNKELNNALEDVGYVKTKGGYKNVKRNKILNLDNLTYDDSSKLITKSNYANVMAVYTALTNEGETNLNTYLKHKSIAFLHNKIANDRIKLDDKNNNISALIGRSIGTQLATKLKTSITIDEDEETQAKTSGGSSKKGINSKDKHTNFMSNAVVSMFQNEHKIAIDNINSADPAVANIMNTLPAGFVQDGNLYFETGYGENNKEDASKDESPSNRKTIKNNKIIQNMMGGQSDMTNYAGVPITTLVDNRDLNKAIIPPDASLHIILAPTLVNKAGKVVTDFTNEFTPKAMQAIANTYEQLKREGITEADIAKGTDKGAMERAQKIAQAELVKLVQGNTKNIPTIRATFAFNIQYDSDGDSVKREDAGWEVDSEVLYSIIDEDWGRLTVNYAKETVAFIPISTSYWSRIFQQGSFPSKFEYKINADRYEGVLKTTPIVQLMNIRNIADYKSQSQYKKKFGGKLASTDDIKNLLFN